ncbi:MAG: hypothetical protein LKF79_07325 [Solobacterium sp.]|jgi:hypothetical protein|nr:hypothetical protein [Solobacterium sp.]
MTKTYIRSFISMRYMAVMPLTAIPAAVMAIIYYKTQSAVFRTIGIALFVILAAVMILYYGEKLTVSARLNKFKQVKDYDQAVIIGTSFILNERTLIYEKGKLTEFYLRDLQAVSCEDASKDRIHLTYQGDGKSASIYCSTKAQAERLAGFLKQENPSIALNGITPSGDGMLEHVETGKTSISSDYTF